MISLLILFAEKVFKAIDKGFRRAFLPKQAAWQLVILPLLSFPLPRMRRKIPTHLY